MERSAVEYIEGMAQLPVAEHSFLRQNYQVHEQIVPSSPLVIAQIVLYLLSGLATYF